jgi:uncharacterized protein HemX
LETANPLNTSDDVSGTQNPQSSTGTPGASNASDFQEAAGSEALTKTTGDLTVETTGEPAEATAVTAASSNAFLAPWGIGLALIIAIALVLIARIKREEMAQEPAVRAASAKSKTAPSESEKKKPAKKSAKSKPTTKKATRRKSTKKRK